MITHVWQKNFLSAARDIFTKLYVLECADFRSDGQLFLSYKVFLQIQTQKIDKSTRLFKKNLE